MSALVHCSITDWIEAKANEFLANGLLGVKRISFEIAFACDTDHDRHGIVTRSTGLLPPNHYLAVAIFYLFQHRPKWRKEAQSIVNDAMAAAP